MYRLFPLIWCFACAQPQQEKGSIVAKIEKPQAPEELDPPLPDTDSEPASEPDDSGEEFPDEEVPYQDGTAEFPFLIELTNGHAAFADSRDTVDAPSDINDSYPPFSQDESGPEYYYQFTLAEASLVHAWLAFPEPAGVDNDLHLLETTAADSVLDRDHHQLSQLLDPGTYYLVVDSFVSNGEEFSGPYDLQVNIAPYQAGTLDDPILISNTGTQPAVLPLVYTDTRDTTWSESDIVDSYPPNSTNESGPEFFYYFKVDQEVRISAEILAPEPDDVDIDIHLLDSVEPISLLTRGNASVHAVLPAGEYWLSLDTYVSGTQVLAGEYSLTVQIRPNEIHPEDYFNAYLLDAVDFLYANYGLLGYDSAALTHDINYGPYGVIERSGGAKTMCVAAMLEVFLTAMELYEADTGDSSVWDFLPERSFEYLGSRDLKGHLWVNHELDSWGSADALRHFGMGENIPFEDLT